MAKGITPVIAIILLLLITISMVGFSFVFFQRTTETAAQSGEEQMSQQLRLISSQIKIDNVGNGKIVVRNIGANSPDNIVLYADNIRLNTAMITIQPNEVKELEGIVVPGNYKIKISSGGWQDEMEIGRNIQYYDYDNFEGGPGSSDDWFSRNGVDPDVTSSTAYRGTYSLHMPSGWGGNFETGTGEPSSSSYDTNQYPYMCMAYRIPSGTINNMLIYVEGVGWRSITMTQGETPCSYPKAASWNPLTIDNNWHYKCINFDQQLDSFLGTGTHTIRAVIWHDGGCLSGITGEFWIDEFIISDTV